MLLNPYPAARPGNPCRATEPMKSISEQIRDSLIAAVTEHDRRQSTRRDYNPYALGQYFAAVDAAVADWQSGKRSLGQSLATAFNDRLLAVCERATRGSLATYYCPTADAASRQARMHQVSTH